MHRGSLLRRVVIENQVHVEAPGDVGVDGVEEPTKLAGPMPSVTLAHDLPALRVQGREQRGRPVAGVVVCMPLNLAGPHRQQRRTALQRLHLALLVDAQYQRLVRRIEIQPDDIADLLDEQRIARTFEGARPVRLQRERLPDAPHRGPAEATRLGQRARTPLRRIHGRGLQRRRQGVFDHRVRDGARRAGFGLVEQAGAAGINKPLPPPAHRRPSDALTDRHRAIRQAARERQHNARALRQRLRAGAAARPLQQGRAFGGRHVEFRHRAATSSHRSTPLYSWYVGNRDIVSLLLGQHTSDDCLMCPLSLGQQASSRYDLCQNQTR